MEAAVITKDRKESLKRLLRSLSCQTVWPDLISVIDNGSTDETKKTVMEFSKILPIRYLRESKVGIPYARNKALAVSKYKILAFIDDDCEADRNWAKEIIAFHRKYENIVAIQGMVQSYPKNGIFAAIFKTVYSYWILKNTFGKKYLKVIDTKNVSLKTELVKKLNLDFDTRFMRGSDVDFAYQLLKKNQKIVYAEKILVNHWERNNPISFFKQRLKAGQTQMKIESKWPSSLPAIERSRARYKKFIKELGKNLPFYKKIIAKFIFQFYGPIFKFSFEKYKNDYSLLKLSPEYKTIGKISVGIITKNRPRDLKRCLFSLFKQTVKPSEIIVVDGSSDLKSKEVVKVFSKKLDIHYIVQKKAGISNARNLVLLTAREEIVGFIDDDCEAEVAWVESMILAHRKYPNADIISGSCYVKPYSGLTSRVYQEDYNNWILNNFKCSNQLIRADIENSSMKIDLLKQKKVYFDEEKKFYYSDDVDLSYQVNVKGGKIFYESRAIVYTSRRNLFKLFIQRIKKGYSAALIDLKWGKVQNPHKLILKGQVINLTNMVTNKSSDILSGELPAIGILGSILVSPVSWIYNKLYKISYQYNRFKVDSDVKRLNKPYLLSDMVLSNSKLSVSVMILTKDRLEGLKRLLVSLTHQTRIPERVIIVDSSSEKISGILKEYSSLKFVYLYEHKKGYSFARNRALKVCGTDIITTVDDDEVVPDNWIENIVKLHQVYPEAVGIQGKIISKPENSIISIVEQLHMNKWFLRNLELDGRFNTLSTKNASFKVSVLKRRKIKFTESDFINMYGGEDVDLANQIISKLGRIQYSAAVYVYHFERKTLSSYFLQRFRKGGSGALITLNWGNLPYRKFYSFFPRMIEPLFLPLKFLSLNKILRYYLAIIPVYYFAEWAFIKGKRNVKERLEANINFLKISKRKKRYKKLPEVNVGIIIDSNKTMVPLIEALMNQTVKINKIIFSINSNDVLNEKFLNKLRKTQNIAVIKSSKNKISRIHDLMNFPKSGVLCILNSNYIPNADWAENLVKIHVKKERISIVSGFTIFQMERLKLNLVNQFIWQTMVRNSMLLEKQYYWQWIKGNLRTKYGLNFLDLNNFSIKISEENIQLMKINREKSEQAASISIANNQINSDSSVLMEIKAKALYYGRKSLKDFMQDGYSDSKIIEAKDFFIKNQRYLLSINIPKKTLAFIYFVLNRNAFWQAPILTFIYLIYLGAYYWGIVSKFQMLNRNKRSFRQRNYITVMKGRID